jgi:poly-gamma-glutamate synthase PgsB/CapB
VLDALVVAAVVGAVLLALAIEASVLRRLRHRLPIRIAVTGTRGKSSVVRLIAAGLTAAGHPVVFKTTGSLAVIGGPDGVERRLRRHSLPTPLEQRGLLRAAVKAKATALVAEAMSIRAESLRAELGRILAPDVVVVTNIRADHVADLADPERSFADAVPRTAVVVCPREIQPRFLERLARADHRCAPVCVSSDDVLAEIDRLPYAEWPENLALALAACAQVGVDRQTALSGMVLVRPDVGAFAAWRWEPNGRHAIVVNGFAANDPDSTDRLLRVADAKWGAVRRIGLLNLRRDRGDRTEQWFRVLRHGSPSFDRLFVVGDVPLHSIRPLKRLYGDRLRIIRKRDPAAIMRAILEDEANGSMIFGFGNIGGVGLRLVGLWKEGGRPV